MKQDHEDLPLEDPRTKIRRALGAGEPEPGLRARVIGSMPIDPGGGSRWQWAAGGVAVLLAVTIVAGLVFVRQRSAAHSAATGQLVGSLTMTAQLDFRCTLPVQGYLSQGRVSLPDGGVTVDQTQSPGKGTPTFGSVYVGGKWLPVPRTWLSPDGRSYAYITSTSGVPGQPQTATVYVHDIAKGTDRKLWSGSGSAQMIIGWGPGGVYFPLQPTASGQGFIGQEVWVVDPANPSAAHRVGPNPPQTAAPGVPTVPLFQFGTRMAGGAAWTVRQGIPKGPIPAGGGIIAMNPAEVVRMDLKDGSLSTWFTAPDGTNVGIAGTDQQGHPILIITTPPNVVKLTPASSGAPVTMPPELIYPPPPRVLLLTSANQTVEISSGSDATFRPSSAFGDGHGIWFTSPGSLWLYRHGSLTKVADVPASLFPLPTPPPNLPTPPANFTKPSPPPGYPIGVPLNVLGPCA